MREAVAEAAAACGEAARPGLLAQLASPAREEGALLALTHLAPIEAQELAAYRQERSAQALDRFGRHLAARAAGRTPGHRLLADSLLEVARSRALAALRAHGLTRPGNRYEAAISGLSSPSAEQRAKAVETIDSLADAGAVRPLLRIWEDAAAAPAESDWLRRCLLDGDPWIRECAALVEAAEKEGGMADLSGLSAMERVLFLREVPLLADLSPADLKHVAAVTRERLYRGGELLMRQGDSGDEMLIIVSGQVQVLVDGKPVATRRSGEALGEMAILTDEPRSASLRAEGDVRVLSLDAATFQSILRERPEVSLGIIRTLSQRLRERR